MADGEGSSMRTRFERVVDNVRFRIGFTAVLCLFYLLNLVLAALSFHLYPSNVDGALAYHVVLSIATAVYCGFFLWRNLDGVTQKRGWMYFVGNLGLICFWLAAFFSLAIELGMSNSGSSTNSGTNSGNGSGNSGQRRSLVARQSTQSTQNQNTQSLAQQANFYPAIGCVVVDVFIVFMFTINLVYIYFRMQRLFPRYAELNDDGNAFDAQMTEGREHDSGDEEEARRDDHPPQRQDNPSYGAYEGQEDYRPGRYTPPARYGAEAQAPRRPSHSPPQRYGAHTPPPSYTSQPYGNTAYGQDPRYPNPTPHEDTSYNGATAYGAPRPGERRTNPTPYPRSSIMGYGNGGT